MTHIWVNKLTIIGSDNGLSPGRRQAFIWTNAGILLIGPLGTNFSEILIENWTFSFKKMHLKMSSTKRRPSCLGLNVLKVNSYVSIDGLVQGCGVPSALTMTMQQSCTNPLGPGRCGSNLNSVIFKLISRIGFLSISCDCHKTLQMISQHCFR